MGRFISELTRVVNPAKRRNLDEQARRLCVISHRHRCIYVMNFRCGSTSLRRAMIELELTGQVGDPAFAPPSRDVREIFTFDATVDRVRRLASNEGYFLFSIVRHPLDRLLSAYAGKLAINRKQEVPIKEWLHRRGREVSDTISFEDFMFYLENEGTGRVNNHWRPQHRMLLCDHFDYAYLGRFESFSDSFREIFERIGAPVIGVPHQNPAPENLDAAALSADMRRRIYQLFRVDYEAFGYPPEP